MANFRSPGGCYLDPGDLVRTYGPVSILSSAIFAHQGEYSRSLPLFFLSCATFIPSIECCRCRTSSITPVENAIIVVVLTALKALFVRTFARFTCNNNSEPRWHIIREVENWSCLVFVRNARKTENWSNTMKMKNKTIITLYVWCSFVRIPG